MIIDFQIHFAPLELVKDHLGPEGKEVTIVAPDGRYEFFAGSTQCDIANHVNMMDKSGVDIAVLSSMQGMMEKIYNCRIVNDRLKEGEERFPGRIKGLAHIPPLGGTEAFAELKRCREELGFRGAAAFNLVSDKNLDDSAMWPFYEKLCEHGMFLFIHPYLKSGYLEFPEYDVNRSTYREGMLQTSLVRLINGGVLDDFPTLKIVYSHLGGGFAANLNRIISYQDKEFWGVAAHPLAGRKCKRDFLEYLDMIMFDTGGIIADVDAIKMALMKVKPTSIVFGTDYPFEIRSPEVMKRFIADIRALPLPSDDIEAMLGGNGRVLIGA
jgi:uncharacterized protein